MRNDEISLKTKSRLAQALKQSMAKKPFIRYDIRILLAALPQYLK